MSQDLKFHSWGSLGRDTHCSTVSDKVEQPHSDRGDSETEQPEQGELQID